MESQPKNLIRTLDIKECKLCGNIKDNELFSVKEMQLGLREFFTYMHCANCGCLQLLDIPLNLSKYYPTKEYYSFKHSLVFPKRPDILRKIKASYLLYGKNRLLGSLLSIGYKIPEYYNWLKIPKIKFDDSILDVGTGNGELLLNLFKIGFTNLTGIDPFIEREQHYGNITVYKKNIFEIEGRYDYIMLNHVFEHMEEPKKVLKKLYQLLNPQKYVLIRTPVMGTYNWNKYRENWMELDAPRHLFIHSLKSIQLLSKESGFELRKIIFDDNEFSLIGSELYKKDIPLSDPKSYINNKKTPLFTAREIKVYKEIAKKNNEEQQGGRAAFYLYKS